jgi:predicted ATP-dependent endonuclease of OLD family
MLRDITIENYRLFEKFHMEGMTQINLLVGANNSGKSSLLEALYLLMAHKDPLAVHGVLKNRGEFINPSLDEYNDEYIFQISEIFRGHKLKKQSKVIIASQRDQPMSLEYIYVDYDMTWRSKDENEEVIGVVFKQQGQNDISGYLNLEKEEGFSGWYTGEGLRFREKSDDCFITTERLDLRKITKLWDQTVLTPKEDMVLEVLRILEPNLERIALLNQTTPATSVRLKIKGNTEPVPLGSMGDGMYRIFVLALSLANCENGTLFVDEIDTGLHYKALTQMWRLVIETAKRLNVQVFATTHSWDCLVAFHKALTGTSATELGSVFRLERKDDQIKYVSYTGDKLAVAIEHDIEVR